MRLDPTRSSRACLAASALVALAAFLPFARGLLLGQSFYFRDVSGHFWPIRRFVVEGLLQGEVRHWNPYVHEGEPLSLPPVSYPLDLLQLLLPSEWGFSLLLALHVPMAAVGLMALARSLGADRVAAAGGGIVYALGGFALSTLNLYIHVQALAWAPLVVLGLLKAAGGGRRHVAGAALVTAVGLSTTGVEIVLQAIVAALMLAGSARRPTGWLRAGAAVLLGAALAAPTLMFLAALVSDSARAAGFAPDIVLAHSVHPLTLLQVVVSGLYGDPTNIAGRWWGSNFFPRGFPYLLSLYLGLAVLALATLGGVCGRGPRRRLLVLALVAAVIALGRWAGLDGLVGLLPAVRKLRFPSKAFFTVHLAASLLTAFGLQALAAGGARKPWRGLAWLGLLPGAAFCAAPALPRALPGFTRWFLWGFFPPDHSWPQRLDRFAFVLRDATLGGLVALVAGLLALAVLMGRMQPARARLALVALLAADLLRAGAGLNPTVTSEFFRLSPEMSREASILREKGGRLFTCDPDSSVAYAQARPLLGNRQEVWSFATVMETLAPYFNMGAGVPTAYSLDLTMLVPVDRTLPPEQAGCHSFPAIVERLRGAGVAHVISLDPIVHGELSLPSIVAPSRIAPLVVRVYGIERPLPTRFVADSVRYAADPATASAIAAEPGFLEGRGAAVEGIPTATAGARGRVLSLIERPGRIELTVETDRPTVVVLRDAYSSGWVAAVNGTLEPVRRANGRHQAVEVRAGVSHVVLSYRPPGVRTGLFVMLLGAALVAFLLLPPNPGGRGHDGSGLCP